MCGHFVVFWPLPERIPAVGGPDETPNLLWRSICQAAGQPLRPEAAQPTGRRYPAAATPTRAERHMAKLRLSVVVAVRADLWWVRRGVAKGVYQVHPCYVIRSQSCRFPLARQEAQVVCEIRR